MGVLPEGINKEDIKERNGNTFFDEIRFDEVCRAKRISFKKRNKKGVIAEIKNKWSKEFKVSGGILNLYIVSVYKLSICHPSA